MNSFFSIYILYFIIVYYSVFRGTKNRASMGVHEPSQYYLIIIVYYSIFTGRKNRGSMDPVNILTMDLRSTEGSMDRVHVLYIPEENKQLSKVYVFC